MFFVLKELLKSLLRPAGIARSVLVTSSDHEWRAVHEFTSAGFTVVPAPVHVWAPHPHRPRDYLPQAPALTVSTHALNELLGNGVRQVFAATHLRRHE